MRAALLPRLRDDARGVTIVEFGIVAPVMCLLLVGAFDIAHTLYTRAQLQGVVQKTARDAALETGAAADRQVALDAKVTNAAQALANDAEVQISRRYYRSFTDAAAARAEPFTDTNSNSRCDAGEPYEDENHNSTWDRDGGDGGQGGAKDAVVYTVRMTYPRMFPLWKMIDGEGDTEVVATTILRNQPYDNQGSYAEPVVRNCA